MKLSKKEVPERSESGQGRHPHFNFNFNGNDWGDFGMNDLKEQMDDLNDQLGDQTQGIVHDSVMAAQAEAQRARDEAQQRRDMTQQQRDMAQHMRDQAQRVRDEAQRARDRARRAGGNITVTKNGTDGGLSTTKVDIGKAQIVYSAVRSKPKKSWTKFRPKFASVTTNCNKTICRRSSLHSNRRPIMTLILTTRTVTKPTFNR